MSLPFGLLLAGAGLSAGVSVACRARGRVALPVGFAEREVSASPVAGNRVVGVVDLLANAVLEGLSFCWAVGMVFVPSAVGALLYAVGVAEMVGLAHFLAVGQHGLWTVMRNHQRQPVPKVRGYSKFQLDNVGFGGDQTPRWAWLRYA